MGNLNGLVTFIPIHELYNVSISNEVIDIWTDWSAYCTLPIYHRWKCCILWNEALNRRNPIIPTMLEMCNDTNQFRKSQFSSYKKTSNRGTDELNTLKFNLFVFAQLTLAQPVEFCRLHSYGTSWESRRLLKIFQ